LSRCFANECGKVLLFVDLYYIINWDSTNVLREIGW